MNRLFSFLQSPSANIPVCRLTFCLFILTQPTRNVGANYLGFFEQVDYVKVHGRQLPAWHALQLGDDEELTDVLQSGHLVHLRTDQEAHGLENAS